MTTDTSVLTSVGNDYAFDRVFARQVEALGRPGDVALGISTSGASPNVVAALEAARALRMHTIALTGSDGGAVGRAADDSPQRAVGGHRAGAGSAPDVAARDLRHRGESVVDR